jgi:MFS family permease
LAALEGYDLSCYGATVPPLLHDHSMAVTKASAGTVGSLVAVGMMIGAGLAGALANRFNARGRTGWRKHSSGPRVVRLQPRHGGRRNEE